MSSRRAAWDAERAALKLINLGPRKVDTFFNADRRAYKKQLSALRSEWSAADLKARRDAYVASRSNATIKAAPSVSSVAYESIRAEQREARARELAADRASKVKANENKDRQSSKRISERSEAEKEFLRKWMNGVLKQYDVEGNESSGLPFRSGKRSWLYPDNFQTKLHLLLMQSQSPVDKWNKIARRLMAEEEREQLNERLGGRLQGDSSLLASYDLDGAGGGAAIDGGVTASDANPALPHGASGRAANRGEAVAPPELSKVDEEFLDDLANVIKKMGPPPSEPPKVE